jgi:hypothetical protein
VADPCAEGGGCVEVVGQHTFFGRDEARPCPTGMDGASGGRL